MKYDKTDGLFCRGSGENEGFGVALALELRELALSVLVAGERAHLNRVERRGGGADARAGQFARFQGGHLFAPVRAHLDRVPGQTQTRRELLLVRPRRADQLQLRLPRLEISRA